MVRSIVPLGGFAVTIVNEEDLVAALMSPPHHTPTQEQRSADDQHPHVVTVAAAPRSRQSCSHRDDSGSKRMFM